MNRESSIREVTVKASRCYNVTIGSGILQELGRSVKKEQRLAVITDQNVAHLYRERVEQIMAGRQVEFFVFSPGEEAKCFERLSEILEWLADLQMTREDMIIALGGGVTGDLAGFAASVYLRGIPFIQIPTTLLAAIDSSVGGKTAVNLKAGKNLAGSFYQPQQVICDVELLKTLSDENLAEGIAEAVKYGILGDPDLFEQLSSGQSRDSLEDIIYHCVVMKRDVVEEDEFDTGNRQLLNLGHTFGHCIEKLSKYEIPHGRAVAVGLALIARAAAAFGHLSTQDRDRIIRALESNRLPVTCDYQWEAMMEVMKRDKKRRGDTITLILPVRIGECILHPVSIDRAGEYLKAALQGESLYE